MAAPKKRTTTKKKQQDKVRDTVWALILILLGVFLFISIVSGLTGILGNFLKQVFLGPVSYTHLYPALSSPAFHSKL